MSVAAIDLHFEGASNEIYSTFTYNNNPKIHINKKRNSFNSKYYISGRTLIFQHLNPSNWRIFNVSEKLE